MSILDQYTFTKSLSVLSSPSLVSLLSCSRCSRPLSDTVTFSSGRCPHSICEDCLVSHPGGKCPVEGCTIPAHTKDYKENRTLGQVARCMENIKVLLERKDNVPAADNNIPKLDEKEDSRAHNSVLENTNVDEDRKKEIKKNRLKSKKKATHAKADKSETPSNTNQAKQCAPKLVDKEEAVLKSVAKENTFTQPENKEKENSKELNQTADVSSIMKAPFKRIDNKTGVDKPINKKDKEVKNNDKKPEKRPPQGRLSLPEGRKVQKGRVRAATTTGQTFASTNTSLNQFCTGLSALEKKNKKGETMLHAACSKGDKDSIQNLLSQGAKPNTQDHAGWTPLHEVATAGRVDLATLLLDAGARPSVPNKDDRITALHDAVLNGQIEMAKLLVARGADRDARDSKGKTPREIALLRGSDMIDVMENTLVEVTNEDFMEESLQPHEMVVCFSKSISSNAKLAKLLGDVAVRLGCKRPITQVREEITHLVVDQGEDEQNIDFLSALVVGAEIVNSSWLEESGKAEQLLSCKEFRCEENVKVGAAKSRDRRANKQPGLLTGLHFYLSGVFDPSSPTKTEIQQIVKLAGGKLLTREPDPEFIPPAEETVPHHAISSSSVGFTSHVILYKAGSKKEPQMKYNMKHVKTLPVSWLLQCIQSGGVLEPGT